MPFGAREASAVAVRRTRVRGWHTRAPAPARTRPGCGLAGRTAWAAGREYSRRCAGAPAAAQIGTPFAPRNGHGSRSSQRRMRRRRRPRDRVLRAAHQQRASRDRGRVRRVPRSASPRIRRLTVPSWAHVRAHAHASTGGAPEPRASPPRRTTEGDRVVSIPFARLALTTPRTGHRPIPRGGTFRSAS